MSDDELKPLLDLRVGSSTAEELEAAKAALEKALDALQEVDDENDEVLRDEIEDKIEEIRARLENDMWIVIDGDIEDVSRTHTTHCHLPMIDCGKQEYYLAEDASAAGEAARKYWQEMAENDPREFTCMVGEETLVKWGLNQWAGPGTTQVRNLEEWLDLWLDTPEEQWAGYDRTDRSVSYCSPALLAELDIEPTVAYRWN